MFYTDFHVMFHTFRVDTKPADKILIYPTPTNDRIEDLNYLSVTNASQNKNLAWYSIHGYMLVPK